MATEPDVTPAATVATEPTRRGLLLAAAILAGSAGAGLAWWRLQPRASAGDPLPPGFWGHSFTTPQGQELPMAGFQGRPLLLNFWATWCPPCVQELPLLDAFYRENSAIGWQVLGIAIDRIEPVQAFLQRSPVAFPVALAGVPGAELGRALGNQAGGLPFTVVLDAKAEVRHRKMGQISETDLLRWRTDYTG